MSRSRWAALIAAAIGLEIALVVLPPFPDILDARLFYTADQAFALLDRLGPNGRASYVRHQLVDLLFIATYTCLARGVSGWLRGRRWTALVPGAFDVLETTGILGLLAMHPSRPVLLAGAIGLCTTLKWAGSVIFGVACLHRLRPRTSDRGR